MKANNWCMCIFKAWKLESVIIKEGSQSNGCHIKFYRKVESDKPPFLLSVKEQSSFIKFRIQCWSSMFLRHLSLSYGISFHVNQYLMLTTTTFLSGYQNTWSTTVQSIVLLGLSYLAGIFRFWLFNILVSSIYNHFCIIDLGQA